MTSRTAACVLVAATMFGGRPSRARAFDYPEHTHATQLAIRSLPPAEAQLLAQAWGATVRTLAAGSPTEINWLCRSVMPEVRAHCFTFSELPAMAGDHSSSAGLLVWRWLDPSWGGPGHIPIPFRHGLAASVTFTREEQSPEQARVRLPDRRQLLETRFNYAHDRWSTADADDLDMDLMGADQAYAALGTRGHPHFRPGSLAPSAALLSARHSYVLGATGRMQHKPENHAYAWYADNHLGALFYADAAHRAQPGDEQDALLAAALLFEVTALHFLQDSVAAGHVGIDASVHNNYTLNLIHDAHGDSGLDVEVPGAICDSFGSAMGPANDNLEAPFQRLCQLATRVTTIHGDGHPMASRGEDETVEALWAALVSRVSLREVLAVFHGDTQWNQGEVEGISSSPETLCGVRPRGLPCHARPRVRALQRNLYRWWETDDCAETRRQQITRAYQAGFFSAVSLLPLPTSVPDDARHVRHVGRGVEVAAATLFANPRDRGQEDVLVTLTVGVRFALPRNLFPLSLSMGVTARLSDDTMLGPTVSIVGALRSYDRLLIGGQAGYLFATEGRGASVISLLLAARVAPS